MREDTISSEGRALLNCRWVTGSSPVSYILSKTTQAPGEGTTKYLVEGVGSTPTCCFIFIRENCTLCYEE